MHVEHFVLLVVVVVVSILRGAEQLLIGVDASDMVIERLLPVVLEGDLITQRAVVVLLEDRAIPLLAKGLVLGIAHHGRLLLLLLRGDAFVGLEHRLLRGFLGWRLLPLGTAAGWSGRLQVRSA